MVNDKIKGETLEGNTHWMLIKCQSNLQMYRNLKVEVQRCRKFFLLQEEAVWSILDKTYFRILIYISSVFVLLSLLQD